MYLVRKYRTDLNFDLMMAPEEKLKDYQTFRPGGGHACLSNSCWDISVKTTNVNLMERLEVK